MKYINKKIILATTILAFCILYVGCGENTQNAVDEIGENITITDDQLPASFENTNESDSVWLPPNENVAVYPEKYSPVQSTAPVRENTIVVLDNSPLSLTGIVINGYEIPLLNSYGGTWFDVPEVCSLVTNEITVSGLENYNVFIDGYQVDSGSTINLFIDNLGVDIGIEVSLVHKTAGTTTSYFLRTLHSKYKNTTSGKGIGDGYYYFEQQGTVYKMDTSGNVVFYKEVGDVARNFKPYLINDTVYYSYAASGENYYDYHLGVGYNQTQAVILDHEYKEIDRIEFLVETDYVHKKHSLENHDFLMLDVGHYIMSGYVGMTVNNIPTSLKPNGTSSVVAFVIQEVKDGELLFEWSSTDYPQLYSLSLDMNDFYNTNKDYADYAHFNSVDIDPSDDNFIFSFRNLDAIVKVDRKTGEIVWILGGAGDEFGIDETQYFSRQHYGRFITDDTISIFDNGINLEQTRVVEFTIDQISKKILDFAQYSIDGTYSMSMGSAQRIDDEKPIYIMGWGSRDQSGAVFTEVDFSTGEVLFELVCTEELFIYSSYRVVKYDY